MEDNTQRNNPAPSTEESKVDIKMPGSIYFTNSTILASISYLGPLIVIPFLLGSKDSFVNFHLKQGLIVFIMTAILWLILNYFFVFWMKPIIDVLNIGLLVLSIIGIINALQKKEAELPLVGKFAHKINI